MTQTVETAVKLYRQLQAIKKQIEDEAAARAEEVAAKMSKLECWLSEKSKQDGTDFKTKYGTVFWTDVPYCRVADWPVVFKYISEKGKWDLLTHGVAKDAITAEIKLTGSVPPGLNYGTKRTMHVRKPTVKE